MAVNAPLKLLLNLFVIAPLSPLVLGQHSLPDSAPRYPNELPNYRFYVTAKWRELTPLIATMKDVRDVLGRPDEAHDMSEYTKPYPGDAIAKKPVFTYKLSDQWDMLVYFGKYCFHEHPHESTANILCSIDLIPRKRISFTSVQFPPVFRKTHVDAVDAAWDEYSDASGLRYEVYTTKTPYGDNHPGDLNRISYGPTPNGPNHH